jgi:hypothetical protein
MQTHRKAASQTIIPQDFLLPEPGQRRRTAPQPARAMQIEDAVFEVVGATPHTHRRTNDNPVPPNAGGKHLLLPLAARLAGRLAAFAERQLSRLSPQAFVTLMSSLFVLVFWLCGGFSAMVGQKTHVAARQPFELVDTFIAREDANGMKIAAVTGGIVNTSPVTIAAPRLTVVSGASRQPIGTITLDADSIGPNATLRFFGRFKLDGGKSADIAIIPERP